jgi:hypothetical protein
MARNKPLLTFNFRLYGVEIFFLPLTVWPAQTNLQKFQSAFSLWKKNIQLFRKIILEEEIFFYNISKGQGANNFFSNFKNGLKIFSSFHLPPPVGAHFSANRVRVLGNGDSIF